MTKFPLKFRLITDQNFENFDGISQRFGILVSKESALIALDEYFGKTIFRLRDVICYGLLAFW